MRASDSANYGIQSHGPVSVNRAAVGAHNTVHADGDDTVTPVLERVATVRATLVAERAAFADPADVTDELDAIEQHVRQGGRDREFLGRRLRRVVQAFETAGLVLAPVAALAEAVGAITG